MYFVEHNANPYGKRVDDCVIRALSKALNKPWECVHIDVDLMAISLGDMPHANSVWGKYLYDLGFQRDIMSNSCPACYTVKDFCKQHPNGTYILALDSHVVAIVDGQYYDTWDCGDKIVLYYWTKKEEG